ncbi:MAG TPA: competence protein ComA, partial [Cupriavidus sp.]|nr:competence protein ComA [Cupriavidus sp.]
MDITPPVTLEEWNAAGADYLPGLLGMHFDKVEPDEVVATLEVL